MILLASIPLGIVVGWLRGGSIHNLGNLPIRGIPVLVIPLFVQFAGGFLSRSSHLPPWGLAALVLGSYLMLVIGIWLNREIRGLGVLAVGFLLNLIAVTANGFRMPLSENAAVRAGFDVTQISGGFRMLGESTRVPFLADVISIPPLHVMPPQVLSVGDVLIMVGLFLVVQAGMCISPKTK